MSYQHERDTFIARMATEGLSIERTLALLRAASTLQRLAEAQCNGDWPADNGERPVVECILCGTYWVKFVLVKGQCLDCRLVERITKAMPDSWGIDTQGDPRGYVLRVIPPSYAERNRDRDRFNRDSIGVPTR